MDDNLLIYFNYKSEISAIEKMLAEIPPDFVIDRIGLEYRRKRLLQKISDFEDAEIYAYFNKETIC